MFVAWILLSRRSPGMGVGRLGEKGTQEANSSWAIWRFHEMGVPPKSSILDWDFPLKTIQHFGGTPMTMETLISIYIYIIHTRLYPSPRGVGYPTSGCTGWVTGSDPSDFLSLAPGDLVNHRTRCGSKKTKITIFIAGINHSHVWVVYDIVLTTLDDFDT